MEVRGFFITSAFPLYGSRSQPKGTLRAATTPHAVPVSEAKATSSHRPRSVDRELEHLTNILELTADPRKQIRPLLKKHHDRIQALLDKNPTVSREALTNPRDQRPNSLRNRSAADGVPEAISRVHAEAHAP